MTSFRLGLLGLALLAALGPLSGGDLADAARKGKHRKPFTAVTRRFANEAAIELPFTGSAVPYPSDITVSGLKRGEVRGLVVDLRGLTHSHPEDLDMVLEAPDGTRVIIFSDAGAVSPGDAVANLTIVLDDKAPDPLPATSLLGAADATVRYRPGNYGDPTDGFAGVAASAALSEFNGINPNGAWRLFIFDDNNQGGMGSLALGWEMFITARVRT
jgi:hypothetical protein